jgi:cytochrome c oxidase subunit 1/cytochrome c oxidase subunit I+III
MITLPSGVQIFAWLATMVGGKPKFHTPMLFVIGFIVIFVIGGLSGVMFASVPFDQATTDTYFVVAHLHYVLVGGAVFPMFAAIYYWAPKMHGRMLSERWGKVSFWLMFVGFNLAFFPMHITGLLGQPRRVYTYQPGLGWDVWNLLETVGAFMFAAGVIVTLVVWFTAIRRGRPAPDDPWGGETLEWATSSPPPHHNFDVIPDVRSLHPMWDQPELTDPTVRPVGRPIDTMHAVLSTSLLDARPQAIVPMPHTSPWPFVLTVAMTALFLGLLVSSTFVAVVGALAAGVAIAGWAWPRGQTQET